MNKFKVGDLVKLKGDRFYTHRWNNPQKIVTLPVAGMILEIKINDWLHPYYSYSKKYEQKEIKVEVAKIRWFEYEIPGFGSSDPFDLGEYNKSYTVMPLDRLADFNQYLDALKKKKGLYK